MGVALGQQEWPKGPGREWHCGSLAAAGTVPEGGGGTVAGQKAGGGGGRAEHVLLWVEVMPVEDDAFSGGWGRQWRGRWCRHSCRWSLRE